MPTYEYACKKCGERFDVVQKFTDRPLRKHRDCGGDLQKVFHAAGVVFKGPGFYVTDSRKAKSSTATKGSSSSSSAASEGSTSTSASTDSED